MYEFFKNMYMFKFQQNSAITGKYAEQLREKKFHKNPIPNAYCVGASKYQHQSYPAHLAKPESCECHTYKTQNLDFLFPYMDDYEFVSTSDLGAEMHQGLSPHNEIQA